MKIRIPQDAFSEVLSRAQSVLERKSTRPILESVLLEAAGGSLRASATDLRVGLVQETACEVLQPGSVTVPGRKLHEILREMPRIPVVFEVRDNHRVTLSAGKSVFHIPGGAPDEYPTLPEGPESFGRMEARVFREMLARTLFAASNDESRLNLCGVYVTTHEEAGGTNCLRMVSTDGHRLALVDRPVEKAVKAFARGVIVPKKALSELSSLLEGNAGDFEVATAEGRLFARIDAALLSVLLIDGAFPSYEQVIPADAPQGLRVPRQEFLDGLRRVSLLSDQESRSVILEAKEGAVVLTSADPRFGDAREEIEAAYDGPGFRVAFNSSYVIDVLRAVDDGEILVSLSDPLSPCLVRSSSDPRSLWVVMPMRLD